MEIERKWLFSPSISRGAAIAKFFSYQGYISIDPEIRIRKAQRFLDSSAKYELCIKGKGHLSRPEIEKDLTEEEFFELANIGNFKEDDLISKECFIYKIKSHELIIAIVDTGRKDSFVYGEIEFVTEEEANNFITPGWFGEEVTYDENYKMANYWKRTREI